MRHDEIKLLSDLIASLLQATVEGSLHWEEVGANIYGVDAPSGSMRVSSAEPAGKHPYSFVLTNAEGGVVEELKTVPGSFYHPWESRLEDLYGEARSKARDVNGIVNSIKLELGLPGVDVPALDPTAESDF